MPRQNIFGQGLSFPPRVGADGRLAWSVGEANVRESIRLILLTEPGERLMRESFGCGLRRFLFEPNTLATRQLIQERIVRALERWEPRVRVDSVQVDANAADERM
ncbi:MAG: GPW/gp25 family protein, partial [Caldilineaceae bacterium]|nr:GPW/gp25 family protein [Caldilineaceae bacterium]